MKKRFGHEKLDVYQESIRFVAWVDELLAEAPNRLAVHDQLDKASTAIPLNIAIGRGKFNPSDRAHFFVIAHDAALECAACLDVLRAKHRIKSAEEGKSCIAGIVSLLENLINKRTTYRSDNDVGAFGL